MPVHQGMESLAPFGDELKSNAAIAAAMAIICPVHPNRSGTMILRSGSDKSGNLVYFEAAIGTTDHNGWRIFRKKNGRETADFMALRNRNECVDRRGPANMVLHYHVSET